MRTLVIEMEHLHTGKLHETFQHMFISSEDESKVKKEWADRLSNAHLKSDYRLSRIYFKNK